MPGTNANPKKRNSTAEPQEEVAHKVAWAAVKKIYQKKGDKWMQKPGK